MALFLMRDKLAKGPISAVRVTVKMTNRVLFSFSLVTV